MEALKKSYKAAVLLFTQLCFCVSLSIALFIFLFRGILPKITFFQEITWLSEYVVMTVMLVIASIFLLRNWKWFWLCVGWSWIAWAVLRPSVYPVWIIYYEGAMFGLYVFALIENALTVSSQSIPDEPDYLHRNHFVESHKEDLKSMLIPCKLSNEQSVLPARIAILGEWGSGKTFVLQKMYHMLKKDSNQYKIAWCSPWHVETIDEAIREIAAALEIAVLNRRTLRSLLARYRFLRWVIGCIPNQSLSTLFVNLFGNGTKQDLQDHVKKLSYYIGDDERLVLFLDDMERANRDIIKRLFPLFDRLTDIYGLNIIMAVNHEKLEFSGKAGGEVEGYLQKVFPVQWLLPSVTSDDMYSLARCILKKNGLDTTYFGMLLGNNSEGFHPLGMGYKIAIPSTPRLMRQYVSRCCQVERLLDIDYDDDAQKSDLHAIFLSECLRLTYPDLFCEIKRGGFENFEKAFQWGAGMEGKPEKNDALEVKFPACNSRAMESEDIRHLLLAIKCICSSHHFSEDCLRIRFFTNKQVEDNMVASYSHDNHITIEKIIEQKYPVNEYKRVALARAWREKALENFKKGNTEGEVFVNYILDNNQCANRNIYRKDDFVEIVKLLIYRGMSAEKISCIIKSFIRNFDIKDIIDFIYCVNHIQILASNNDDDTVSPDDFETAQNLIKFNSEWSARIGDPIEFYRNHIGFYDEILKLVLQSAFEKVIDCIFSYHDFPLYERESRWVEAKYAGPFLNSVSRRTFSDDEIVLLMCAAAQHLFRSSPSAQYDGNTLLVVPLCVAKLYIPFVRVLTKRRLLRLRQIDKKAFIQLHNDVRVAKGSIEHMLNASTFGDSSLRDGKYHNVLKEIGGVRAIIAQRLAGLNPLN